MYGFNPLAPLDLLPMSNISVFKHKDAYAKADYVSKLHESVKAQIFKKMKVMLSKLTREERKVVFELGDCECMIHDFDDAKEESNKVASKDKHCFNINTSLLQQTKPCFKINSRSTLPSKQSVSKTSKPLLIDYTA